MIIWEEKEIGHRTMVCVSQELYMQIGSFINMDIISSLSNRASKLITILFIEDSFLVIDIYVIPCELVMLRGVSF